MILTFTYLINFFLVFCCAVLCLFVEFRLLHWFFCWVDPSGIWGNLLAWLMMLPLLVILTVLAVGITCVVFRLLDTWIVQPVKQWDAKRKL